MCAAAVSGNPDGRTRGARAQRSDRMEALTPWLTPALLIALFTWLRRDTGELCRDLRDQRRELNERLDKTDKRFDDVNKRFDDVDKRFDDVNKRFDEVNRELAELRERMAKLEGSLEGFLAGRRDRDAA
jgi:predicted nuclease with TOPRIM domain